MQYLQEKYSIYATSIQSKVINVVYYKMFKSFVTTRNPDPDSIGSDANYVASFMRSDDMLPARKTTKSIIRAIIGNISIQALCVSPSKAYLDVIRKIVSMYE